MQRDGLAHYVAILKAMEPKNRLRILQQIRQEAPYLAKIYDELEFCYEDLIHLDDSSLQTLIRKSSKPTLLLAFKLTGEPLRQRFLENMSKDQRQAFLEEFDKLPKVRKSQVIKCQRTLAKAAHDQLCLGRFKLIR